MRRIYLVILFFCVQSLFLAQRYAQEWINYSQKYYKFPLTKEGVYRIDSTTLASRFDLSQANPDGFQLWLMGRELPLYIKGGSDGKINTGDYIEFYAQPRSALVDSSLYSKIAYQPNPFISFFNDTIPAFITLSSSLNNKRFVLETDTNTAGQAVANYCYSLKNQYVYNTPGGAWYNYVDLYNEMVYDPNYTQAEGIGYRVDKGNTIFTSFNLQNLYSASGLPAYLRVVYSGNSRQDGTYPDHRLQLTYNDVSNNIVMLQDTSFFGYTPVARNFVIPSTALSANSNFTLSSLALPSFSAFSNSSLLHYVSLYHPQTLTLSAQSFYRLSLQNTAASGKTFFNFSNLGNPTQLPAVLLDLANNKKIETVSNGNYMRALVPPGAAVPEIVLAAEHVVQNISQLQPVNGNGQFIDYRKNVNRTPYLLVYHPKLQSSAQSYAGYRSSPGGGSYEVISARVDQLYDQFSYGVNKHPIALKNFARLMYDSLAIRPGFMLLVGKAMKLEDLGAGKQSENLVPTMGIPSSDNLLTTALDNDEHYYPQISIGRLAATNNQDVLTYLDKVREHESSGNPEWKKRVLHFVGGDDENLNNRFSAFMANYERMITDTLFGGRVFTFRKNTTAPVQTQVSDSVKQTIEAGASLLNFFGHGSEIGFDQGIDDPQLFNNAGRYPFIIANSCYSGNVFVFQRISISERFVFARKKGSIGFIATSSYGLDQGLDSYSQRFYKAISYTHYGKAIGDIVREACYQTSKFGDVLTPIVGLEMCLHGDPAVVISAGDKPDYQLGNNKVSFDLRRYTDSIGVTVALKNTGKAVPDSVGLKLTRIFPMGDSITITRMLRPLRYLDTFRIYLNTDFEKGLGLNKFRASVDYGQRVLELDENNNGTNGTVDLFVPGSDLLPVYPYKYAILPNTKEVVLKASTTDPFSAQASYIMELDTTDLFSSVITRSVLTSKGGVLEWKVNLPYKDSTVYYWRVSRDSTAEHGFLWKESSFQVMSDKRGWGQSHFYQYKQNSFQYINYNRSLRKLRFENNRYSVMARSGIIPNIQMPAINCYYNNILIDGWSPMFNGWNLAVFDSATGKPWRAIETGTPGPGAGQYNNCASQGGRWVYSFGMYGDCQSWQPTVWKKALEDFMKGLPRNVYVLGYTTGWLPPYGGMGNDAPGLYDAFESFGVEHIRDTPDSVAHIFFGKKGWPKGQAQEVRGANKKTIIYLTDTIATQWQNGNISSTLIGPSYGWNEIQWKTISTDAGAGDTCLLKVVGYRSDGTADTLLTATQNQPVLGNLGQTIDYRTYRYLRLVCQMKDNVNRTASQLKYWRVLYDEAPECAINPLKGFRTVNDTLQEGDVVEFRFPLENISHRNFEDSLVITYWLEDNNRNKQVLPDRLKRPGFAAGSLLVDTVKVNSLQLRGNNTLWIQVNPVQHPRYQFEQEQYNNTARYAFSVYGDNTNPLLDVTFDGVRILNGDIVSARPHILVTLKDENKFLALNDTAAFSVYLQAPGQSSRERIYFAQGLEFTPASLPKNSASIQYKPTFTQDGRYTLSVQARDRSSNKAGNTEYQVQFEISTKPGITQVMNYPNPFTTSTHFVFTLTGSDVPEIFTIQVMTITGKVVREITRAELGDLHIGRNITEYAWDGRDNYGDRLANGVYLYKVNVRLNGQKMDLNGSGADQFFTKEIGKMVLMR